MPVHGELFDTPGGEPLVAPGLISIHHPSVDSTRHKSEVMLRMKADGRSTDDIAREVGVSRSTVIRLLRYVERAAAS